MSAELPVSNRKFVSGCHVVLFIFSFVSKHLVTMKNQQLNKQIDKQEHMTGLSQLFMSITQSMTFMGTCLFHVCRTMQNHK